MENELFRAIQVYHGMLGIALKFARINTPEDPVHAFFYKKLFYKKLLRNFWY